jgi:hypothetical protein
MRILYTAFDVVPSPKGASVHITQFVRGLIQAGYKSSLSQGVYLVSCILGRWQTGRG